MKTKVLLMVLLAVFSTVGAANADWFGNAVENVMERTGQRAMDEAADSAYESAKEQAVHKPEPGRARESRGAATRGPAGAAEDDEHYIQVDDFFIAEHPLQSNAWIPVSLAKMVSQPSRKTKGEAEFFKVTDGAKEWTKHFWRTRIVQDPELKLGTVVVIFEGCNHDDIYWAPRNKEEARGSSWFMAKITDMSDSYKGYVTVSGNYKVDLGNLRVLSR